MRLYSAQPAFPAAKIKHYKQAIAIIGKPRTYADRLLLNIYKQIVNDYEKSQK